MEPEPPFASNVTVCVESVGVIVTVSSLCTFVMRKTLSGTSSPVTAFRFLYVPSMLMSSVLTS